MSTNPPSFTGEIQSAVRQCRAAIAAAFYEAFYFSWEEGKGEVAGLIHFFTELPDLQEGLNSILKGHNVSAEVKGVFCHKAGASGPVVNFNIPSAGRGCELSDLLMLVTYSDAQGRLCTGNATFLQAKTERAGITNGMTASTKRQRELYESAPQFTFTRPELYAHRSTDDPTHGSRSMPGASTGGFCYWSFCSESAPMEGRKRNSSSITIPSHVDVPECDTPFGETMYSLLSGDFGLPFVPPTPGEHGWNRIVFDVVLRAVKETLSCSAGIADVKDLPRVLDALPLENFLLRNGELAAVLNPFERLAEAFGNDDFKETVEKFHRSDRTSPERLLEHMMRHSKGDGPPEERSREEESGGGGSFIHINLQFDNEKQIRWRSRK